jgi:hypothetical protein
MGLFLKSVTTCINIKRDIYYLYYKSSNLLLKNKIFLHFEINFVHLVTVL